MPIEVRKIAFEVDEIIPVILDYCRENGIYTPSCHVQNIDVLVGPQMCITLSFASHGADAPFQLEVDKNRLHAALIMACSRMKIPLPRAGEKRLQVEGGSIHLVFGTKKKYQ